MCESTSLPKSGPETNLVYVKGNRWSWALLMFAIVIAIVALASSGSGATRVHHSNRNFYPQRWTGAGGSAKVEEPFQLFKSVALNATFYFADDAKKAFPYVKLSEKSAKSVKTGFISTPAPDFKVAK
jgi:hypothetical protein